MRWHLHLTRACSCITADTAETTGENRDEEGAGEEGKRDGEVGETAAKVDETNNVELSEEQQREKDVYKRKIDFMRLQNTYRNDLGRIGSVKPSSIDIVGHKITAHTSIVRSLSTLCLVRIS
jgi:hypothetical protein